MAIAREMGATATPGGKEKSKAEKGIDGGAWLFWRFPEESNAIDYLEKTVVFIKAAKDNPQEWKWVSIAIHGALYGFKDFVR